MKNFPNCVTEKALFQFAILIIQPLQASLRALSPPTKLLIAEEI
jgi:hypothetical protein